MHVTLSTDEHPIIEGKAIPGPKTALGVVTFSGSFYANLTVFIDTLDDADNLVRAAQDARNALTEMLSEAEVTS